MVVKSWNSKVKKYLYILMIIFIHCLITNSHLAFADYVEVPGDGGDGGLPGCESTWTFCTAHGGGWSYLKIKDIENGVYGGVSYDSNSDTITMYGSGQSYTPTGTITGCKKAGGVYRFAMRARVSGKRYDNGDVIAQGDFVGMLNPRSSDRSFQSVHFGGGLTYNGGMDWDDAKYMYACTTGDFDSNGKALCNGKDLDSDPTVAAFCGWGPNKECTGDCCPGDEGYPNCPNKECIGDCCPDDEGYPNCPVPCDPATDCCPNEPCYDTGCVCPTPTCGEDTSVTVKQKNSSSKIESYNSWTTNKIYAKPSDKIDYIYTYCAGVQSQAFDTVTTKHGSEGCEDTSNTNKDFSDAITWNNYYKVSAPHSYSRTFTYDVGDVTDASSDHSFNVEGSDVGKVLDSTITSSAPISASSSNDGIHTWEEVCSFDCACGNANPETGAADTMDCPCPAESFSHDNNYYSKSYTSGPDSESVDVRIPYNYRIDNGKVNIKTDIFFAGETFTLTDAKIDVITAYSETLKETYATKTQSATISLYSYYVTPSGSTSAAVLMDSATRSSLNSSSNLEGYTETFFKGKTYSIYDIPAGSNMCLYLVSSIGKSSSNPDSNAAEGTYTSPTVCKVIYKKPSFQIWGGSLYTGSSNLKTAYKTNVSGYYNYGPNKTDKNTAFGSWVEYAVVYGKDQDSAAATGIASGASSSYSKDSKKPGGSLEPTSAKYCKRAPLTISNTSCASDKITKSGITTSSSVLNSIYGLFIDGHSLKSTSNNANLSNASTYNEDKRVRYTSAANNTNISASDSLPVGITHVVHSDGTINITSNLTYENTPLTSISQMPQYIIYAKNINIACNVTRIDGWVIAKDGTIKTCSDGGDDNSSARSKQLVINGPVIAKSVVFGRTYGAASGKNSVVPAEIFNMTPITNLWSEAGASNTPTLHSQYIRELAPRY